MHEFLIPDGCHEGTIRVSVGPDDSQDEEKTDGIYPNVSVIRCLHQF